MHGMIRCPHTFGHVVHNVYFKCVFLCVLGLQQCVLCGQVAHVECSQCFTDSVFSTTGFKVFCETCSAQVSQVFYTLLFMLHEYPQYPQILAFNGRMLFCDATLQIKCPKN